VKPFNELERERDHQRNAEDDVRKNRRQVRRAQIATSCEPA
jgi:hypothetical protein